MEFKNIKRVATAVALTVFVSACAAPRAQYTPYPTTGKSAIDYNRDIADCQNWARGQAGASPQRALNEGARGAVILGLAGAILGALAGDAKLGGFAGATLGALGGGARGSQQAQRAYDYAYRDCLNKKGY